VSTKRAEAWGRERRVKSQKSQNTLRQPRQEPSTRPGSDSLCCAQGWQASSVAVPQGLRKKRERERACAQEGGVVRAQTRTSRQAPPAGWQGTQGQAKESGLRRRGKQGLQGKGKLTREVRLERPAKWRCDPQRLACSSHANARTVHCARARFLSQVPIVGVVENMGYVECPCGTRLHPFGRPSAELLSAQYGTPPGLSLCQ